MQDQQMDIQTLNFTLLLQLRLKYQDRMINLCRRNLIFRHSLTRITPKILPFAFKHANSPKLSPLISANSIANPSLTIRNRYFCSAFKELSQEDADYIQKLDKQAQFFFSVKDYEQARRVLMPMADFLLKKGLNSQYSITLSKIASSYIYQYKLIDAVNYFQKAIKFLDGLEGNFYSQKSLIKIEYAETLIVQNDYDKAEKYLNECAEYLKQNAHMLEKCNALFLLARINQQKQKYEDAIRLFTTQLIILQQSFEIKGKIAKIFSSSLIQLSACYQQTGDLDNALKKSLQAKSILQAEGLQNQAPFAIFLFKLGQIHKSLNQIEQYFDCYEKAIVIIEPNSDEKAFVMNDQYMAKIVLLKHRYELGFEYLKAKKIDKGLTHLQSFLQMHKQQDDKKGFNFTNALFFVANIHQQQKQNWVKAAKYYEQFLDIHKYKPLDNANIQGAKSNEVLYSLNKLAQCYANLGKSSEALFLYLRIKPIFEALGRRQSLDHAFNLINTAKMCKRMNKMQQFFQYFSEGLAIAEQIKGKDHPDLLPFLEEIGRQYYQSGDIQALPFLQRCYSMLNSSKQKENRILSIGSFLFMIGTVHHAQQNWTQALKHYQQALEIIQKHQNCQGHIGSIAYIFQHIADAYNNLGDLPSSLQYALSSLEVFEKLNGKKSVNNVDSYMFIADIYRKMGKPTESEQFGNLAKELQQKQENNQEK